MSCFTIDESLPKRPSRWRSACVERARLPLAPRSERRRVRLLVFTLSNSHASFTASSAISRYVVSFPPVTVTTPLSDVNTLCRRLRSAVLPAFADVSSIFTSGRSPDHTPLTSSKVTSVVTLAFNAARTYSMSSRVHCGSFTGPL